MLLMSRFAKYFAVVSKAGSIRRASETLHVSPSAIDRQLLQAEEDLGVPLFERVPGGLRLTAAGELVADTLRRWSKDHGRLLSQIEDLQGLKRGHVQVAVIDALAEGLVPDVVEAAAVAFPGVTVGVRVLDNEAVAQQVASGDVDLGLLLWPPVSHATQGIQVRASIPVPLGLAVPIDHPLARRTALSVADTLPFRIIVPGAPLVIHEQTKALYRQHRVDVDQFMTCNNTQLIRALVRKRTGVGVLSWIDAAADVLQGRLAFVPFQASRIPTLALSLCVSTHSQPSRAARELMQRFEEAMQVYSPVGRPERPVVAERRDGAGKSARAGRAAPRRDDGASQ
ncbi:LysR family transcriptional regulator [Robbsia sp. KACC 23696]|uniref:LysR family transcriptional regulator n=1 Tax=Robbsia sp. KACC 23696 TaxID=3149231 RepID=UPI00325A66CB